MLNKLGKNWEECSSSFLAPKYSGLNKHFVRLPELGVVIKPSLAALPLYSNNPPLINLA